MFDIAVTEEVVEYAKGVLTKHNFGRRGVGDGSRDEQLTGLVGQLVIQDLFDYPRTDGSSGPDGGVDLVFHGLTIDVKTMGRRSRPRPHYTNNYPVLQAHFPTRIILFCSLDRRRDILTVCGWIFKDVLLRIAEQIPAGTLRFRENGTSFLTKSDLYEIQNSSLYNPRSLTQLQDVLRDIAIAEGACEAELPSVSYAHAS